MSIRSRSLALVLAPLLLAGAAAACSDGGEGSEGGGPIPQQFAGETYPGPRGELSGTLEIASNGCFLLEVDGAEYLAVWPRGTESLGDRVRLTDGRELVDGDAVTGTGTLMPTRRLAGIVDGFWGMMVGFCTPDATEVAVLDVVA